METYENYTCLSGVKTLAINRLYGDDAKFQFSFSLISSTGENFECCIRVGIVIRQVTVIFCYLQLSSLFCNLSLDMFWRRALRKVGYVQVMFFSLAVLTYGTAVPSGQFVPGIMIGATYGRLVGILVVNASSKDSVDEGTYVLGTSN